MWVPLRRFCTTPRGEFFPHSTIKIFRKGAFVDESEGHIEIQNAKPEENITETEETQIPCSPEYRENEMRIQMLSRNLYKQVFAAERPKSVSPQTVKSCLAEMTKHKIEVGNSPKLEDVILKLPVLKGKDIEEHFFTIAKEQSESYRRLIESILGELPPIPEKWSFTAGWTKYSTTGAHPVDFPDSEALVFDVEICVNAGSGPTMATAVGPNCWYSWTSPNLINIVDNTAGIKRYTLEDLIPLEKEQKTTESNGRKEKVIIGHNVSFDRARVREQYHLQDTGTRFVDTMSLHVCVSGITSYQRAMLKSKKQLDEEDLDWSNISSLNSLAEVYQLYCESQISKEPRDIFVKGSLQDVQGNFDSLMTYCANDVLATQRVLCKLFPLFLQRFPHPATLAGMLEIGSAYLPVNSNWNRYIKESDLAYEDLNIESKYQLSRRADAACQLLNDEKFKTDLWMWDEDWSTQEFKLKKKAIRKKKGTEETIEANVEDVGDDELAKKFEYLYSTKELLPVRRQLLPGYPAWYRKLCAKPTENDWCPGPQNISTGMQVAPKLLSLCWEGYPLHYSKNHGWGFLVPFRNTHPDGRTGDVPIEQLAEKCPVVETDIAASLDESNEALELLWRNVETNLSKKDFYRKKKKDKTSGQYTGTGVWCNESLEDCCWFIKLPHKDGASHRVGNPLAKDFLSKFSENVLSGDGEIAERVIDIARMLSYWRNNRDRITQQLVVWLPPEVLPKYLRLTDNDYGAIIPQVVVCGTLTRRAMEPTWMTASNAQRERVGSELRSMIQAPPGYKIVGADVDSQELWIASVLGDAYSAGMHGATPLGWMTLSGTKASGTDMHSVTAKAVGISRDHAKVINYARIYGAGQNFAERLLKQFNPTISDGEARSKAMKMFTLTKGKRLYYLLPDWQQDYPKRGYSGYEALKIASSHGKAVSDMFDRPRWEGGTESAMFNRLEQIAGSLNPVTPFLNSRLSRALEPKASAADDRFLPTRVNWVVQSGAVDFLHLMTVCMRWLMGSHVRFCLSFHDEVRYLVKEENAYKAALAMHVTNLLTRSFCAKRIGLADLPQSIAFFASVEVDTVLRKESSMDCKTPSNTHGLEAGYGIPKGESLDIHQAIEKAESSDLSQWEWHLKKRKIKNS